MFLRPIDPLECNQLSQIALAAKAHWGYPERWLEIWVPELTFDSSYFEENPGWAAVIDNQPVAFYTWADKQGVAWVENLFVKPEFIGKGVGKQLFLHALDFAREHGHKVLQLEADPNAIGFYEKMGMHKIGERTYVLEGELRRLPIMEMDL